MSHLPLDARAILDYLNELGYRNISAQQLKEFLKDLRKLIKYEEKLGIKANQENYYENLFKRTTASYRAKVDKENAQPLQVEEKLHCQNDRYAPRKSPKERSTKASKGNISMVENKQPQQQPLKQNQLKSKLLAAKTDGPSTSRQSANKSSQPQQQQQQIHQICGDIQQLPQGRLSSRSYTAVPRVQIQAGEQNFSRSAGSVGRSCSPRPLTECHQFSRSQRQGASSRESSLARERNRARSPCAEVGTARSYANTVTTARSLGVMVPRRCTATRRRRPLQNDPVALFHFYQSEWNHFREQIPGESSHSQLRWQVRARLLDPN